MQSTAKTPEKLLFLDFDGVCNSFKVGSYKRHSPDEYGPDPAIMSRIREICDKTGARVVISSNWRKFEPDGMYAFRTNMMYPNPLDKLAGAIGDLVVGTLPKDRHISKSQALELWFEYNSEFKGRYAILDDDPREGFQSNPKFAKNFWLTNPRYGLTEKTKEEIIKHFRHE